MTELLSSTEGTTTSLMGRMAMMASAVVVLSAVEVGWWWFQRFRHLQYRKDHPNTIFLTEFRPRPTRWGRALIVLLRVLWTVFILATFGGCVAIEFVVVRGVGSAARCVASGSAALWAALRARRITTGARPPIEASHTATASTFVLAPILRSKPTVPTASNAGPPFRASSLQWASKGAKKGVTFQEHSNGHIRHKQVSFDPASATSFSVEESRTPPPGPSAAPSQQPSKARMAQTPPLPRRGRAMGDKENGRVASEMLRRGAAVERPGDAAPATPQNSQTPESMASTVSRPDIPPYPAHSERLEESLRKRRASSSSSHGYSPAVKRMYGRLRLPPQATSQVPYQYQPHVVARKMKRQRENDLILWKAFTTVPSADKKAAVEVGSAVPVGSGEATAASQSSSVGSIPPASNNEAATIATLGNPPAPNPQPAFHFGSSAPAPTPLASAEGAPAAGSPWTGGAAAPESSTAGAVAAAPSGIHFGFGHTAPATFQNGGTEPTSSGGDTFKPGEDPASTFPSQLGSSTSKPEVNATTDKSGSPFPLGMPAPAAEYSAATPLTQNPGGSFQASFSSGVMHSTDGNAALNTGAETSAPQRLGFGDAPNTSVTAAPTILQANFIPSSSVPATAAAHPAATTLQSSVPTASSASTVTFQFGFGNPPPNGTAANSLSGPTTAFGAKTPDPAAQPSLTPASSTVFTFGAGPEQATGTGGGSASAPTFQFGSSAFGTQGFGVGTNGAATGGFASSGTMSNAPFAFGHTAVQPTSAAQPFASSTFSGAAIGAAPARPRVPRKPSRARPPRR